MAPFPFLLFLSLSLLSFQAFELSSCGSGGGGGGGGSGQACAESTFLPPSNPRCRHEPWHKRREQAREMFHHAWNSYKRHAAPWDELKPLSCTGRRWDKRERGTLDDSLGGFMTTAIDTLDTLALLGEYKEFRRTVRKVVRGLSFDRDITVSVFETNIRILGGLLSSHMLLKDEETAPVLLGSSNGTEVETSGDRRDRIRDRSRRRTGATPPQRAAPTVLGGYTSEPLVYNDELLDLALDLGHRLLPAFRTKTGIPYHRVNLKYGVPKSETKVTCLAAAGTLILEFGVLSRLSGISSFETAARRAIRALWKRRSPLNLMGSTMNIEKGTWVQSHASVGAGSDSFYEYILKAYVLFGDEEYLTMFETMYEAIEKHLNHGAWKIEVDMNVGNGKVRSHFISSLSAFWPALQVLAGDVKKAQAGHGTFYSIWKKYSAMPEIFDMGKQKLIQFGKDWPLRPELLESSYHLYVATRDPYYLSVAEDIMNTLNNVTRVKCGFASIADVSTHRLDDRMDSYFLAETLKYLYLIFDEASRMLPPIAPRNATKNGVQQSMMPLSGGGVVRNGAGSGARGSSRAGNGEGSNGASSSASNAANSAATGAAAGDDGSSSESSSPVSCITHRNNVLYASCSGDGMTMSSVKDAYTLLDMQRVVFTTEGHTFLLWPSLRSRRKDKPNAKPTSKRGKKINQQRRRGTKQQQQQQQRRLQHAGEKCPNEQLKQEGEGGVNSVANAQHTSDELVRVKKARQEQIKKEKEQKKQKRRKEEQEEQKEQEKQEKQEQKKEQADQDQDEVNKKKTPKVVDASAAFRNRQRHAKKEAHTSSKFSSSSASSSSLDDLSDAIGAFIATNDGYKFSIECNYKGRCKLVRAEDTITQSGGGGMGNDWNVLDVNMYLAEVPKGTYVPIGCAAVAGDENAYQECMKNREHVAEEIAEERNVRITSDNALKLPRPGRSSAMQVERAQESAQEDAQENAQENVLEGAQEGEAREEDSIVLGEVFDDVLASIVPTTAIVAMTASPALFGPGIPASSFVAEEAADSSNTESMNSMGPGISAQLNMIEPFYFGCADPADLDPSLKGSAALDPSLKHSMGFGMIVYRGLCSFTQKARLAQWLGSSLLVVVDSDTQGYVHNPPSRSTTEKKEEVNRLDRFFQQLRRGQLPDELASIPLNQQPEFFSMADDGTGLHITIPSVFISKSHGVKLIKYLMLSEHWPNNHTDSIHYGRDVRIIMDVTSRTAPLIPNPGGVTAVVPSAPPLEFSLASLRHVGILPEHIISQIANGLANGQKEDVALEVKTALREEEEWEEEWARRGNGGEVGEEDKEGKEGEEDKEDKEGEEDKE